MEDYPSNSFQARENKSPPVGAAKKGPKEIQRVTKGEVIRRKKPLGTRFRTMFIGGDARSVWGLVAMDVLIPATKDMIADAGREIIERMLFGESRSRGRNWRPSGYSAHTPYNRYATTRSANASSWQPDRRDPRPDPRPTIGHRFDDIVLETRGEAEEVIDQLLAIVAQYDQVSLSDLYSLVGIRSEFTDQKYGWTDLRGARAEHVRGGGYLLNLPKPEPLD